MRFLWRAFRCQADSAAGKPIAYPCGEMDCRNKSGNDVLSGGAFVLREAFILDLG